MARKNRISDPLLSVTMLMLALMASTADMLRSITKYSVYDVRKITTMPGRMHRIRPTKVTRR